MIVIARKYGKLGNRLQLFAHCIAAGLDHGVPVVNTGFLEYARYFQSTRKDLYCYYPPRPHPLRSWTWLRLPLYAAAYWPSWFELKIGQTEWPLKVILQDKFGSLDIGGEEFADHLRERRAVFLHGYNFRHPEGVRRHADAIREYFRPLENHEQAVDRVITAARATGDVLVGVHIRHGDYAKYRGGEYYYPVERYRGWMLDAQESFAPRNVSFLLCSDTEHDLAVFGELRVARGPGHLVEDMYALARCDYVIGPPSSFTTWASFYGDVPVQRFQPGHEEFDPDAFTIQSGC